MFGKGFGAITFQKLFHFQRVGSVVVGHSSFSAVTAVSQE